MSILNIFLQIYVLKIYKRLIKFSKSELFKTSLYNGISNLIRIFTGLISNKIVAVYLGPAGVALLGQFGNFVTMVTSFANLGIPNGVVKYTAEHKDDHQKIKSLISTSFYLIILSTLIASAVIFFGRFYFSDTILKTREYLSIFVIFALTLWIFTLNTLLSSIMNGFKEIKKLIITNNISTFVGLLLVFILVMKYGVYGAFLSTILNTTVVCFFVIFFIVKSNWFKWRFFFSRFDYQSFFKLFKFILMNLCSILTGTFIQMQIRSYIMDNISVEDAGYWQGITKISDIYMNFIITTITMYYLPRLSEIKENSELKSEILRGYKFLLPLTIISSLIIWLFKDYIVNILFTSKFLPMLPLFTFQLIGNVLKISSWLLSYLMIAKAMTKTFIATEIIFSLIYYFLTIVFVKNFGVIGTTYSWTLNYFIYLGGMLIIFKNIIFKRKFNEK